jgi:hypothetical protein
MPLHPPPTDLAGAFLAAQGSNVPIVEDVIQPGGAEPLPMAAVPFALEPLGGGLYALIEADTNGHAAHVYAGAASVYYVARRGQGWRVVGKWPQIAWGGESGGQGLRLTVRRDLGPTPMLVVSGRHMGQGFGTESAVIVRLDPTAPRVLGRAPLGADDTGAGSDRLPQYSYSARIAAGWANAVTIVYDGWTAPPSGRPRTPLHRVVTFRVIEGCLRPTGAWQVPDVEWQYTKSTACQDAVTGR